MLYVCYFVYVQFDFFVDFVYLKDIVLFVQRVVVLLRCNIICLNGSGGLWYVLGVYFDFQLFIRRMLFGVSL